MTLRWSTLKTHQQLRSGYHMMITGVMVAATVGGGTMVMLSAMTGTNIMVMLIVGKLTVGKPVTIIIRVTTTQRDAVVAIKMEG